MFSDVGQYFNVLLKSKTWIIFAQLHGLLVAPRRPFAQHTVNLEIASVAVARTTLGTCNGLRIFV